MSLSFSSNLLTSKMELTPMRLTYKGVDLGGSLKGVTIKPEFSLADIKADQSGETVRDRRVSGLNITIETDLAQIRDKSTWKVVFPSAHLETDGISGAQNVVWVNSIGDSMVAQSGILILHPLSLPDADLSGDYKFFKATANQKSEIVYGPSEQARLKIVWDVYPDDSVQPDRFFVHGDPTIGIVHASFTGPTYVGTGNGTMTGTTVYDGFTKTETITATCIQAITNSGKFLVQGSLSGVLGVATVGSAFVAPEISFTINDGLTDFIVNDQFTIPTTAANFA